MLRHIDRLLIAALVLTGLGQIYLLAKSSSPGASFAAAPGLLPGMPASSMPGSIPLPGLPVMPLTGEIAHIEKDGFSLKNTIGSNGKDEVRFVVNGATEMVEQVPRDPKKIQAEMADFQKEMQKGSQPGRPMSPPRPYDERKITLSALKVGDRITVIPGKAQDADHPVAARIVRQSAAPAIPPPIPAAPSGS